MNETYSGFIAIVGRPNVGKSTLLNAIMQKKIAITSDKPQTTRHRISGILTLEDTQMIFVDTPGMHKGKDLLNKRIDKVAVSTLKDVDVVLFVVDHALGKAETHIIEYFKAIHVPVYVVINKIDLLDQKKDIDAIILSYMGAYDFAGFFPLSATKHTYIDKLLEELKKHMNKGPFYYPVEMKSDQSDETMMKELIREKILYHTSQEVPHAVGVIIESFVYNEAMNMYDAHALIYVERATQKGILLGKNGEKMKKIATEARLDINKTLSTKVHLELWIKVKKNWRNQPTELNQLGYGDDMWTE